MKNQVATAGIAESTRFLKKKRDLAAADQRDLFLRRLHEARMQSAISPSAGNSDAGRCFTLFR
jgi:hypothetical protein